MNPTPIVRTFRAPDPRAALAAIKAALGDEAVIVSTREVRANLWSKPEIEVTATLASAAPAVADAEADADAEDLEGEVASLRRVIDELRSELRSARGGREPGPANIPPDGVRLFRHLCVRGVDEDVAELLVRQVARDTGSRSFRELSDAARRVLRERLAGVRPPWESGGGRKVMAVIGPTGVGKTTTLAKIAARALLESRLRVALVTIDTYRIGASEHIGRYGEIMGVPVHEARDATGLRRALAASADADLVLIDTAGRSDGHAMAAQVELLRTEPEVELHLVLSAASGGREIAAAARRHRELGASRLCFTKLDEADGPGSVLSAATVLNVPVSCLCDGQRVPDDLHAATGGKLVDFIFGT
jgi:flagellar biosynthesis protein FlhF